MTKLIYNGRPEQGLVPYFTPEVYDEQKTDADYYPLPKLFVLYVQDVDGSVVRWTDGPDRETLNKVGAQLGLKHWVVTDNEN